VTLLIVDDNQEIRRMIRSLLEDLSTEIHECEDGAQAVAAYEQYRPDWVLMDLKMREVDGIAATRQIVADFPAAKICIVTNYDDAQLREAAQRAGACEYVVKENLLSIRQLLV
jgi:CheY-like chemotaxis protein